MKRIRIIVFSFVLGLGIVSCNQNGSELIDDKKNLVWSDEFDYDGNPDPTKWDYDLGDGCPTLCGWGNDELQFYTKSPENVRVENGQLIIEVHKNREHPERKYSSARLKTKNKGDWKYGYIEIRAKLPTGRGSWPAIWMLPTNWKYGNWPASGEIDIMEHVGYDPGNIHGTVHTAAYNHNIGTQKGDSISVNDAFDEFHDYAIKWDDKKIDFMVDGKVYNTFINENKGTEAWPFDQKFHLILNIAVGGNWGGSHGVDDSVWPQKMIIEYVRVYEIANEFN
ncbi:glycoside hydrolase family 16 protein [Marinigracilibium pacificum]|uniref:Glycoside hydrolase family 16 protein n=1 Tax=Marinigracilibium pacificum TaxID=2729599 RepID=A0A848IYX1_9BACT|nr:glycoside hydrolase family 16 protein [Marinigracilibium pacificum]NMM48541.1 glycoside hydrolase family 16 protein [Marinigracilibium pacificum]